MNLYYNPSLLKLIQLTMPSDFPVLLYTEKAITQMDEADKKDLLPLTEEAIAEIGSRYCCFPATPAQKKAKENLCELILMIKERREKGEGIIEKAVEPFRPVPMPKALAEFFMRQTQCDEEEDGEACLVCGSRYLVWTSDDGSKHCFDCTFS